MALIKRVKKGWKRLWQERRLKKAKKRPAKAVLYIAPYEHPSPEIVTELARHGVKVERHDVPFIKQQKQGKKSVVVKRMPSRKAVEFAKIRNIIFTPKKKGKT